MKKNDPIEIRAVGNGFHVVPENRQSMSSIPPEATLVFQSMAELTKFLDGHFKHREKGLKNDSQSISLIDD